MLLLHNSLLQNLNIQTLEILKSQTQPADGTEYIQMEYPERASDTPIQLPVFDISKITPDVGKSMIDAATQYGFLYVDSNSSDFADHDVEGAFEMVSSCVSIDGFFGEFREVFLNCSLEAGGKHLSSCIHL